ncbi:ARM repeat-containing protein [Viridothelium virens]|uniref:ARM repeat-containing protein n=1 Tax=Viridothelium virens TaxID=1048519 RepID=A0A6A6H1E3_VIRVR|nr:ARM repeat-containing protein [Viridothelium virens]
MAIPMPQSVHDVEQLIKLFYQPGHTPAQVAEIQEKLQTLQRSNDGWQLADTLLRSDDQNVRFFGALTYTVKINQTTTFERTDADNLIDKLLEWIKRQILLNEGPLVMKKLCSTLAVMFLRREVTWTEILGHLMHSLSSQGDDAVIEVGTGSDLNPMDNVSRMSPPQIEATLEVSTCLSEEASKLDRESPHTSACYDRLRKNLPHIRALLLLTLPTPAFQESAFRCFSSWVNFARLGCEPSTGDLDILRDLVQPALQRIYSDTTTTPAVTAFTEILDHFPAFLRPEHRYALSEVLRSNDGRAILVLLQEEDADAIELSSLLLSYGNAVVADLVHDVDNESTEEILSLIHGLLKIPGFEDYDRLAPIVEFWNNFSEFAENETISVSDAREERHLKSIVRARSHVQQACEESVAKSVYPPPEKIDQWTDQNKQEHRNFRREVTDLLESSTILVPQWTLPRLIELTGSAVSRGDWANLEASLWAVAALSHYADLEPGKKDEQAVKALMESSVFSILLKTDVSSTTGLQRTAVDLLGEYTHYFVVHPEDLPGVLHFLFSCLESFADASRDAAHSIAKLCDACRKHLTQSIDDLLEQYHRLADLPIAEDNIQRYILQAIATVVQATAPAYYGLQHLLGIVEGKIEVARQLCDNNKDLEQGQNHAFFALRCLYIIGSSLEVPADTPIDLEENTIDPQQDSWVGGPEQRRICADVATVVRLAPSGDIIEEACKVFRSGFSEHNGPFAFPPEYAIDFILSTDIRTPRFEAVLHMCSPLLAGVKKLPYERIARLLQFVIEQMQALGKPSEDPGIAQRLIEVSGRILTHDEGALLPEIPQELMKLIFDFSIECLRGPDPLPKHAAASFWSALLTLPHPAIPNLTAFFGPPLAAALVQQVTGAAARGDLIALTELIRKLVPASASARAWFEAALQDNGSDMEADAKERVGLAERRRYVGQLFAGRGGKVTRRLVVEFWKKCRGLERFT